MKTVNPIGRKNLMFRRTTDRYSKTGTMSKNQGYLSIARDRVNGQFVSRREL